MSDQPLFSTIIASYNRADLIGQTIDSVLAQQCCDQEIIVVDDGSTDRTREVLADYGDQIMVLHQGNRGAAAARNAGIARARGRYIAMIDSDDLWPPWTLATYKKVIDDYDSPAFIASHTCAFGDELPEPATLEPAALRCNTYDDYYASSDSGSWVPLCGTAVRTDIMREVGALADHRHNYEETDLWMRLGMAHGFVRIEEPVCSMRREHNQCATLDTARSVKGVVYMIQQENEGNYPGSTARRCDRLKILTRHVRPLSIECLRMGTKGGWHLYRETFAWHLLLRRLRYLLGFPIVAVFGRNR